MKAQWTALLLGCSAFYAFFSFFVVRSLVRSFLGG